MSECILVIFIANYFTHANVFDGSLQLVQTHDTQPNHITVY